MNHRLYSATLPRLGPGGAGESNLQRISFDGLHIETRKGCLVCNDVHKFTNQLCLFMAYVKVSIPRKNFIQEKDKINQSLNFLLHKTFEHKFGRKTNGALI